jgi:hypothetical protein
MFGKDLRKRKFDSKNPDDSLPKEHGEYIPLMHYLHDKRSPRVKKHEMTELSHQINY